MKKRLIIITFFIFTTIYLFAFSNSATYDPAGRKEYIFAMPTSGDSYFVNSLYDKILDINNPYLAFNTDNIPKRVVLPVNEYLYKKLYIESTLEVIDDYYYDSIVLETGERYVFRHEGPIDDQTVWIWGIRRYSDYVEFKNTINEKKPFYKGSNIRVTGGEFGDIVSTYYLSDGGSVEESEWKRILLLLDYLQANESQSGRVVSILTSPSANKLSYQIDEFDKIAFIAIDGDFNVEGDNISYTNPPIQLYLGIKDGYVWTRLEATYQGRDTLSVKSLSLGADNERWDSGPVRFQREIYENDMLNRGNVEVMDIVGTEQIISFMTKFCNSEYQVVRFRGEDKYADRIPSKDAIEAQIAILNIYETMTKQ